VLSRFTGHKPATMRMIQKILLLRLEWVTHHIEVFV